MTDSGEVPSDKPVKQAVKQPVEMTVDKAAEMANQTATVDLVDGVATVTLNRPETLNALNEDLFADLTEAVRWVEDEPAARVMVLTGSGRGFCSGADLKEVAKREAGGSAEADPAPASSDSAEEVIARFDTTPNPLMRLLRGCRVPTVARVNGVAAGGGFGLALACDVAVAARSAWFVSTFTPKLGIVPDLGVTWSLAVRAGRARALGLAMLGERISADQAADWGLIWKVVDDDQLDAEVAKMTEVLKRSSTEALRRVRSSIDNAGAHSFDQQLDIERDHQAVLIPMNMAEGSTAFVEKRAPNFNT